MEAQNGYLLRCQQSGSMQAILVCPLPVSESWKHRLMSKTMIQDQAPGPRMRTWHSMTSYVLQLKAHHHIVKRSIYDNSSKALLCFEGESTFPEPILRMSTGHANTECSINQLKHLATPPLKIVRLGCDNTTSISRLSRRALTRWYEVRYSEYVLME